MLAESADRLSRIEPPTATDDSAPWKVPDPDRPRREDTFTVIRLRGERERVPTPLHLAPVNHTLAWGALWRHFHWLEIE